jgi:hypothetical protein
LSNDQTLIATASTIFIRPRKQQVDTWEGEVQSAGETAAKMFNEGDIVIYPDNEKIEFTIPETNENLHTVYYYRVLGKYITDEKKPESQSCSLLPFDGMSI